MLKSLAGLALGGLVAVSAMGAAAPALAEDSSIIQVQGDRDWRWRDGRWRRPYYRPYYYRPPPVVYYPPPPPPAYYYPPPQPGFSLYFRG